MGNDTSRSAEQRAARRLLKDYLENLPASLPRQVFNSYCPNGSEVLEDSHAILFIRDLLQLSGQEKHIKKDARNRRESNFKQYYEDYVLAIFHHLDPQITGKINFDQLCKIDFTALNDFFKAVTAQGSQQREFTRRLRVEASKKPQSPNLKKSKKKKRKASSVEDEEKAPELDTIDIVWEKQMEEEEIEELEIKSARQTKALTENEIYQLREQQITGVTEILGLDATVAQALLTHLKWDKDRLILHYLENKEKLFQDAKVEMPKALEKQSEETEEKQPETFECSVCLDDVSADQYSGLEECKHFFCDSCWKQNLEMQISEGHTFDIICMASGCSSLVEDKLVRKIVDPEIYKKYARFLSKNFVDSNEQLRWCPWPGCETAVYTSTREGKINVGKCSCGYQFCYNCNEEAHPPLTCQMVKDWKAEFGKDPETLKWLVQNDVDTATLKWLSKNTKDCPNCGTSVQKNAGCFVMTCGTCRSQWCWLCQQDWSTHGNHFKCSKYKVGRKALRDKPDHKDGDKDKKKVNLNKFAHYFKQFTVQTEALKKDDENKKADKIAQELTSELPSLDVSFVREAFLQMKECRLTLKYSFVKLYFETNEITQAIYENLRSNLEMVVERLRLSLEKPINEIKAPEVRNITQVAKKALQNVLDFD